MGSADAVVPVINPERSSRETLARNSRSNLQSYIWQNNESLFSRNVDRWISGDTGSPTHANIPPESGFREHTLHNQRHTLPPDRAAGPGAPPVGGPLASGFWYLAALVLPLLSYNGAGARSWRCSPSALLNTAEALLTQVSGFCGRARSRLRRAARDQGARDLFAGAIDVVLIIYAFGFLLISLYQASVYHQFE